MAADQSTKPLRWLPVVGWEGFYEVSDAGDVRSVDRTVVRRDGTTQFWPQRQLKASATSHGYRSVVLSDTATGRRQVARVHRLVAFAFISNPSAAPEVNHLDGQKANNAVDNLEWTTPHGNRKHAWDMGLRTHAHLPINFGMRNGQSVLTDADVLEARRAHAAGATTRSLARRFCVDAQTMRKLLRRETWHHLLPAAPLPEREKAGS